LEEGEQNICTHCRFNLPRTNSHKGEQIELARKFWGKVPIKHTLAYLKFTKGGKVQRLLHQLKYQGHQEIGEIMGKWYGYELCQYGYAEKFDLILPVPLHASKLIKRGYNQSDSFARGLSESMQIEWSDKVLKRIIDTKTQTKKKRLERWQNVEEIFVVQKKEEIDQKRILLVDDIVTTGSTLEACAETLYKHQCSEVGIATIAMAI
jgi:ComF family protein